MVDADGRDSSFKGGRVGNSRGVIQSISGSPSAHSSSYPGVRRSFIGVMIGVMIGVIIGVHVLDALLNGKGASAVENGLNASILIDSGDVLDFFCV